jgi:SAM-dependent methyltransferase
MNMIDGTDWPEEFFYREEFNGFPLASHRMMLDDAVRMRAYSAAIKQVVRPGAVVVDLGTGTGILAFLAAQCGARKVVAFDASELITTARAVKEQCFADADISFHKIDLLTGRLPRLQADVMVFEIFGSFGIDENAIAIVQRARSSLLRRGGRIIPEGLRIFVCPVESPAMADWIGRWNKRPYGIDLSPYLSLAYDNAYLVFGQEMRRLAAPACITHVDFRRARSGNRRGRASFRLTASGHLHGFVSWFEADLCPGRVLSTEPQRRLTHWGNVFFPVGDPLRVTRGDSLSFTLTMQSKRDSEWRWRGSLSANGQRRPLATFDQRAVGHL